MFLLDCPDSIKARKEFAGAALSLHKKKMPVVFWAIDCKLHKKVCVYMITLICITFKNRLANFSAHFSMNIGMLRTQSGEDLSSFLVFRERRDEGGISWAC